MTLRAVLLAAVLALPLTAAAQLRPFPYFASGAVLQRDQPIPVWGAASPGFRVRVAFADTALVVQADGVGRWRVEFPARPAGGPYAMSISSDGQVVDLDDIYVGDVWIASGQSNMEFPLSIADGGVAEAQAANDPLLRQFKVPRGLATEPSDDLPPGSAWGAATSFLSTRNFSAVAYYFGRRLRETEGIPIGILNVSYAASRIETWMSEEMLGFDETTVVLGSGAPSEQATVLYNRMIHPFRGLPVAGVLWYQGEWNALNVSDAIAYTDLFPTMITGWREVFGRADLPFVWIQLPNYGPPQTVVEGPPPTEDAWPQLRASQSRALTLPNTGEVVAIETANVSGNGPADLHPANKRPLGERAARIAQRMVYGHDVVDTGPRYRSSRYLPGGRVAVRFDGVARGLRSSGPLDGFTLAGTDSVFVWADAVIVGDSVVVSSPAVPYPTAIRYAWQYNPGSRGFAGAADLTNSEDLPAAPFEAALDPGFMIARFGVRREVIEAGQSTDLSWLAFDAAVTLNGEAVASEGERRIAPTETTTYTLTAQNGTAPQDVRTAEVTVTVLDSTYVNRSRGRAVRASTEEACCGVVREAALAVDSSYASFWSSAWSDGVGYPADPNADGTPDDEWIEVDLGAPIDLTRVVLTWGPTFARRYRLEASYDSVRWQTLYTEAAGNGGLDDVRFDGRPYVRYFRVHGLERASVTGPVFGYNLVDLAVYGPVSVRQVPTVRVGVPGGNVVAAGASVTLTATANDPDGVVSRVVFRLDDARLAMDDEAPFEVNWTAGASGIHTLVAIATDDDSISVWSEPLTFYVDWGQQTRYEAEGAAVTGTPGGVIQRTDPTASGGSYLDLQRRWSLTFRPVLMPEAGQRLVTLGYRLPAEPSETLHLVANGDTLDAVSIEAGPGGWMKRALLVALPAGMNQFVLYGDSAAISLDYLAVDGVAVVTEAEAGGAPLETALLAPYPNPFQSAATITYQLGSPSDVRLTVLDLLGREVGVLADGPEAAGTHTTVLRGGDLQAGVYLVRFAAGATVQTRRVTLTR